MSKILSIYRQQNYDESGSPRRTTCLKYLVLANMLMKSDINPFDSQETTHYKNDPDILAMTNLVRFDYYYFLFYNLNIKKNN